MQPITLMGQLFNLEFPFGSTMQPFLMKGKVIHEQLLLMDSALTSLQLTALILTKLPPAYDMVSHALRVQVTNSQLDFDDLCTYYLRNLFCCPRAS